MPETTSLVAFLLATVTLVAVPGPNLVYIVTRSVAGGTRAGVVSALGVEAGTLVHVVLTSIGLSAVLGASPVALRVIKYAGAAYLVYLAVRALRAVPATSGPAGPPPVAGLARTFADGVLVNLLNPKVILFFLAFLPQFTTGAGGGTRELLVLGVIFFAVALLMDLGYAVVGGLLARRQPRDERPRRWPAYLTTTVYAGLAGYAILSPV